MSNNKYSNFTTRQLFEELEKEDASDIHQGERPALDAERVSKMIASNQSLVSALKSVNNAKELEHTLEVIFLMFRFRLLRPLLS